MTDTSAPDVLVGGMVAAYSRLCRDYSPTRNEPAHVGFFGSVGKGKQG